MRKQEEGEPVDAFITALYALAEHCSFGMLHDELIRDRIVVGIRNSALSEKLQLSPNLRLSHHPGPPVRGNKGQQQLLRGDSLVGSVKPKQGNTDQKGGSPGAKCQKCGWKATQDLQHCPARNAVCWKCHKRGHFQYVCRSQVLSVNTIETATGDTGDSFLGTLGARESPWEVTFQINNKPITFNIDTGAEVTVVSEATHRQIGSPVLVPPDRCLKGPDSHTLSTLGYFTTTLTTGGTQSLQRVYVVEELDCSLLGRPAIEGLGLVSRVKALSSKSEDLLRQRFPRLFSGLGKMDGDYTIKLKKGVHTTSHTNPSLTCSQSRTTTDAGPGGDQKGD